MVRLEFLKYMAALAAMWRVNPIPGKSFIDAEITKSDFGKDFNWGVATSAYQIEGAWNADGKGESVWDRFTSRQRNVKDKTNGNHAIDFYNRSESDLKLLKSLNFENFRFSFSWSRILPDGTGKINEKGIDFYNKIIDTCLELGIEPWTMLYHWDLPQKLDDRGGWTNRDIVDWFSEYTEICTQRFGDRIHHWMVLNEPAGFTTLGYLSGMHAPNQSSINKFLASVHHACLCQAEGGRIIRNNVKDSHIGTTFSCSFTEPYKSFDSHHRAARRLDVMLNRLFIEPSLGMGYPTEDLPFLRKIDKYIQPGDLEKLKFDFDFIGIQNYFRVISKPSLIPFIWANKVKPDRQAELTDMGWEVNPEGIYNIIIQFAKYPVKEIIISENGAAFPDQLVNGEIHDVRRINFYKRYLQQILRAKKDGANIKGYFAWTFIDNFEWAEGFRPRFGIVYNDFKTQERTVKDSGWWFRDFLK
ncbi:MAG TPA: GH1 family beta-glucosidase [Prolixibacteraceae bacterium]|nr:GH1 family beta-glucosidase [Prolixibacteraceae bacterium]